MLGRGSFLRSIRLAALSAPPALAAGIVVKSDADNAAGGDGACTLCEAINNANTDSDTTSGDCTAGSGTDKITLGVSGTIVLSSTLPAITDAAGLVIDGAG
jgi:hypothetical protein